MYATTSKRNTIGGLLIAAVASGTFATAAVGSAPTANATCASFFGIGNSANCVSSPTSVAIAIGTNAVAVAGGLFGIALTVGNDSSTQNNATGVLNFSTAFGDHATAAGGGITSLAVTVGNNSETVAGTLAGMTEIGNSALNFGNSSGGINSVVANGIINNAVNVLGNVVSLNATGIETHAGTLGGDHLVSRTATDSLTMFSMAIHAFGSGNQVTVGPGPLAFAISVFQTNKTVTRTGPGVNIDGLSVGSAAAPSTAAGRTTNNSRAAVSAKTTKPHAAHSKKTGAAGRKAS
jgi:hypothetical protein